MPLVFSVLYDTAVYRTFTVVAWILKENELVVKVSQFPFKRESL